MEQFHKAILNGVRDGFSDLHITGGHPLVFRRHGIVDFDKSFRWTHQEIDTLVRRLLSPQELDLLRTRLSVDLARTIKNIRVRINVFLTTRGLSLAMRLLPGRPPTIDGLNLHPSLKQYCRLSSGLILICGSTGSGKSTTIAGMLEEINSTRAAHIITLEDPIEYRFISKKSFIEQRELRSHIPSFDQGLLDVLREDPDVIVVGEIREPETIKLTLNAVEAGHLVIASLHATNSEDALYRIGNSFPPDAQDIVRSQLASTLALLVVQKLIQPERLGFRVPLLSMLRGNNSVKGIIRENRLHQIESTMQTSRAEGMLTMEQYLRDFLEGRKDFTSPDISFRATEEVSNEVLYQTPILLEGAPRPAATGHMAAAATKGRPTTGGMDGDHFYVIEDAAPMDEVLTELSRERD
jgi:pilus retraction protein PilT